MTKAGTAAAIEVRVDDVSQLFDPLDPFPFHERDLDRKVEEYIVGWARELPKDRPLAILVHLPDGTVTPTTAGDLGNALRRYFDYRAGVVALDLNELFRVGRRSLAIGFVVLALCLAATQAVAGRFGTGSVDRFIEESLILVGWVANWRPIEIFLYDWWPISRRRRLYRRLAAAKVEIKAY